MKRLRCFIAILLVAGALLPFAGTAQILRWETSNGPYGAASKDIVRTPAGTFLLSDERNGVWRSTDGCAHWVYSSAGLLHPYAEALAVLADGSVLAGTQDGPYRSTDDGQHWSRSGDGMPSANINVKDIVVLGDGTVFLTAWESGVFRSGDHGASWTSANNGLTELRLYCLHRTAADHLFAGSFNSGVFRSTDRGASWTPSPLAGYVYSIGSSPAGVLFAGGHYKGVYRSTDNGNSWILSDDGVQNMSGYGFAFRSEREILFGVSEPQGMRRSTDGGVTWQPFAKGYSLCITRDLVTFPDGDCYATTYGDGVYRLRRDSVAWRPVNEGVQGSEIRKLAFVPGVGLFAGGYGGAFLSTDAGGSWAAVDRGVGHEIVYDLLHAHGVLYAAGTPGGVRRSTDFGAAWEARNTGITRGSVLCLCVAPDGRLYAGSDGDGLFTSTNQGATWTPCNTGLISTTIRDVCTDAAGSAFAATSGGLFVSTDSGAHWSVLAGGLPDSYITSVLAADGMLYAGGNDGLFRSSDGGRTWTKTQESMIYSTVYALSTDHTGAVLVAVSGWCFRSTDRGATWETVGDRLPYGTLFDVREDAQGGLYVATATRGVYRLVTTGAASCTVATNPPGKRYSVDGTEYAETHTFTWQPGSTHELSTAMYQDPGAGTRHVWTDWSDGGAITHSIVAETGSRQITANFRSEYFLTMSSDGAGSVLPESGWCRPGVQLVLRPTPEVGQTFLRWEGTGDGSYTGTDAQATITMNGPITEKAFFTGITSTREVTLTTAPPGRRITVDGQAYTSAHTFTWEVGSSHEIGASSPQQGSPGIRYVWNSWSDGQPMAHTYVVASGPALTLTAQFDIEYSLTMNAGAGGTVAPGTSWQPAGSQVQIRAIPAPGHDFDRWEGSGNGSYSGTANPATVTMNAGLVESAVFRQVTGTEESAILPAALQLGQNAPNPCGGRTFFRIGLPAAQAVTLRIHDLLGRECARAVDRRHFGAGTHTVSFDASSLRPGVYLYRLETPGGVRTGKMSVVR